MLKVIADDLGLRKSVNEGIIFLLKGNKIDGASLMSAAKEFNDAIAGLRDIPDADIGVHINFVEEKSLVSGRLMPGNHRIFFLKYMLGIISNGYIKEEAEVQIKNCLQAGIKPAFINGNQHLHLLPGIMNIAIGLAKKYDIPYIRVVNEPVSLSGGKLFRKLQLLFLNFLSSMAKKKIRKAGLQCNDYFIGFVNAGNLSEKDINKAKRLTEKYPDKVVELGCHPGHEDEELRKKFKHWGNYNWQKELELLTNDK